jgi:chemotaxis family two-component system response regulator Rcp1
MSIAKILVVEDNPSDVFFLRRSLKKYVDEVELEIAPDGERALEFIRDLRANPRQLQPCVILLDLHLPKFSGLEVLRRLREEPVLRNVEVVVTTNLASPEEEKQLQALQAHSRLKPTNLAQYEELALELIAICRGFQVPA